MSDDTPTERFEASGAPATVGDGDKKKSKLLILILSIVGGLLLIAVVVLLTLLFSRGIGGPSAEPVSDVSSGPSASSSETPSASPSASPSEIPSATPSESPSASPSSAPPPPPPPPPATGPVFTAFSPANNSSVGCSSDSGPKAVTFSWTSTGANEAAIGVGTMDAFAGPYETGLPPSGSYELNYQCDQASQIYTVSIRGTSGQTNKTITLKR